MSFLFLRFVSGMGKEMGIWSVAKGLKRGFLQDQVKDEPCIYIYSLHSGSSTDMTAVLITE